MISVFNHVTIDGFFAGSNGETSWLYTLPFDEEWHNYTHSQAGTDDILLFGRITYEMMKSYWPTEEAIKNDPSMANALNNNPKIVFSKTISKDEENLQNKVMPDWKNVSVYHQINPEEILRLKGNKNITILGSGSIVQQFTNLNLIDEYFLVVVPVVLGRGKSFFSNVSKKNFKLIEARTFKSGIVLLHYKFLK